VTCDIDCVAAIGVIGGRLAMIGAPLNDRDVNPASCQSQATGESGRTGTNDGYFERSWHFDALADRDSL
jgi:hypothetical protein